MHFLPSKSIQAEPINAQYSVIDNSIMNMIRNGIEKGVVMNINNQSFGTVNGSVNNIENGNSYNTTNINACLQIVKAHIRRITIDILHFHYSAVHIHQRYTR